MITEHLDIEPIIPMGHLVHDLGCEVSWKDGELRIYHPLRGPLPRADGHHVGHIHSDQGHEFQGHFKQWCRERGIHLTRTPGNDPRSNGRAETAVKSIKTQIRRILLQAGAEAKWWPWATCFVNELNRAARLVATGLIGFSSWLM